MNKILPSISGPEAHTLQDQILLCGYIKKKWPESDSELWPVLQNILIIYSG
jgi:hypothetical protein